MRRWVISGAALSVWAFLLGAFTEISAFSPIGLALLVIPAVVVGLLIARWHEPSIKE